MTCFGDKVSVCLPPLIFLIVLWRFIVAVASIFDQPYCLSVFLKLKLMLHIGHCFFVLDFFSNIMNEDVKCMPFSGNTGMLL